MQKTEFEKPIYATSPYGKFKTHEHSDNMRQIRKDQTRGSITLLDHEYDEGDIL